MSRTSRVKETMVARTALFLLPTPGRKNSASGSMPGCIKTVSEQLRKDSRYTAVQNNLPFSILPASMLRVRRLWIRFSDEVASAAVQDHVAKSVTCMGIGVMAGHPKGALSQVQRSR